MKKTFIFLFLTFNFCAGNLAAQESNLMTAVMDVAQETGPAVVAIKTERIDHYRVRSNYFGNSYDDQAFDQFFENFFGLTPQYEHKSVGLGSGVIIDARGYILTNDHVVDGADKIIVTLPDGRKYEAQLTGVDSRSDLAVIKITPSKTDSSTTDTLPVATIGNSENLKIGQWVVAIGNPFGNVLDDPQPTVTSGVVSALHRNLPQTSRHDSDYSDLIQTDAAINPGNSGGPLVNLMGEVIGINVAIFSTSGGYQGVGFAIPINYAKAIVDQLIDGKKIEYGWIGIRIQDIDPRLAQYFSLAVHDGVLITKVLDNAPASKAGLKEGDIILSVNKIKIRNSTALIKQISTAQIGKPVTLQIWRDQKNIDVSVTVEHNQAADNSTVKSSSVASSDLSQSWHGLTVNELTPDVAKKLNLANSNGVLITKIKPSSPAHVGGLEVGDVIIAINKTPIRNLNDYHQAAQAASGNCLIRTVRGFFVIEP